MSLNQLVACTLTTWLALHGSASAGSFKPTKQIPHSGKHLASCSNKEFWFDGACRDTAWVFQVFGKKREAAHLQHLGGLGDRFHGAGNKLLLVEKYGSPRSPFGVVVQYTLLRPERPATIRQQGVPTRGGYAIERVSRRSVGFPGPQMTLRFREELVPKVIKKLPSKGRAAQSFGQCVELVAVERKSVTTNYRTGRITICDLKGCTEAIASMSLPPPAEFCGDVVEDLKHAGTLVCDGGVIFVAAGIGCLGGGLAGVLAGGAGGGSVSIGALTIPGALLGGVAGCLGTGVTGGLAAGFAADPVCSRLTEVLVPDWLLKGACISAMSDGGPQPTIPGVSLGEGGTATQQGSSSVSCVSDAVKPDVTFTSSEGQNCVADVIYACTGVMSGGNCLLAGDSPCSFKGLEAVTCGGGPGIEIESGVMTLPK